MIILIDNYDSFTYNLYHFLGELGAETVVHRNDKISVGQVISAKPEAIVISPGPATPDEAGICLELIDKASASIPVFGVCLGLQSMGQGFGGKIVHAKKLMHGKVSKVHHGGKGVFAVLPQDFPATRYHSRSVGRDSQKVLAWANQVGSDLGCELTSVVSKIHLGTTGGVFHCRALNSR